MTPWSHNNNPPDIGFQPLKIERSGLLSLLRTFQSFYDERGISPVIGGGNKVHPHVIEPVIEKACAQGIRRFVAIDDRPDTLFALREQLLTQEIDAISCYHITRDQEGILDNSPLIGVGSLSEVEITPGELWFIDFDRTLAKTDEMKLDLCQRLAALPFHYAA